jgi:hypothetical protein
MAIGTTAMVLGGISAGTQLLGAWNSRRASKKAGEQQAEGARQAMAPVQQAYRTQMGLMDPYAALGRQSANTLGRLMQPGIGYNPQMQAADARAFQAAPSQWMDPASALSGTGMGVPRGTPGMAPLPFMPFARPQGPLEAPPVFRAPAGSRRRLGALMPARRAA